ncbi:MAG: PAS domain-containing protein [Spirochaetes bacterium]|nr:PAS domain-containing protein [Spirochaetota bacterium]
MAPQSDEPSQKAYYEEKERILRLVLSSSVDLYFLYQVDGEGQLRAITMNESALKNLRESGVTAPLEAMIGLTRRELYNLWGIPLAHFDSTEPHFQKAIAQKSVVQFETENPYREAMRYVSITISPSLDESGAVSHLLWVAHDITAIRRSERSALDEKIRLEKVVAERTLELQAALDRAESGSRAKSDFLSRMSHELRTPMHAILSFAELGRDQALSASPEKLKGFFSNISQAGAQMLELLNDLLDLSRLEARKMVFDLAPCRVAPVIGEVLEVLSAQFRRKGMTAEVIVPVDLEVVADRSRLSQVFRNLLSNAVKYSPDGTAVTISANPLPEGGGVDLSVADQGYGIPEGELESIFDRFTQSSRTRTGAGGSGLGLAICRELALAHGGRIWAEANPGGGTIFHLLLPPSPQKKEVP